MKTSTYLSFLLGTFSVFIYGCSDVGFSSLPSKTCTEFNNNGQVCIPGQSVNTYKFTFRVGDVDILIVNDNSGSMYPEQQKMAQRFPNFLSSISNLFYQIAMITTDVTSSESGPDRKANGFGAFRDGKFLPFAPNEYVLTPTSSNLVTKFQNTIQRQETLECGVTGSFEDETCPSGDERGIYALNLAVDRNQNKFFRSGAHLAVVILSDEDVRSNAGSFGVRWPETLDLPETFLQKMLDKFPTKTVSVHAIIIRPGDTLCLNSQVHYIPGNPFPLRGFEGRLYAELALPAMFNPSLLRFKNHVGGVLGNICATDYGAQLGDIGSFISSEARQNEIQLPCVPDVNDITIKASNGAQIPYQLDGQTMKFNNLPLGVSVEVSVACSAKI